MVLIAISAPERFTFEHIEMVSRFLLDLSATLRIVLVTIGHFYTIYHSMIYSLLVTNEKKEADRHDSNKKCTFASNIRNSTLAAKEMRRKKCPITWSYSCFEQRLQKSKGSSRSSHRKIVNYRIIVKKHIKEKLHILYIHNDSHRMEIVADLKSRLIFLFSCSFA